MKGSGYSGSRADTFDPDRSRYPKHVPTLREQLEGSNAALDPDDVARSEVEALTAKGVVANPMALRQHYEPEYEADSVRARMDKHTTPAPERHGWPVGFYTDAAMKGPDHDDTVYPSKARE